MLDSCEDDHDDVILGKPFLKLVNAILDVGKGIITLEIDGMKHEFNFRPEYCEASPLPLDNEEVEIGCFVDSFRDPLQRSLEDDSSQGLYDQELADATKSLEAHLGTLNGEKIEDIGDFHHQEKGVPDVDLKPLPKGLKYEFLGDGKTFPVIVSDELSPERLRSC